MLGGRTGQRGTREPRESLCPSAVPGRVAPVTVLPRAACCMYGAAGTRGPRAQWEEWGLVQRRRVCHGLRWGRRSGSGLLMAASSRSGPSLDAPAHTARARVHAAGTDVHAQLHMCACPNRPSCNLGWASGLSNIDSAPAPCRGSTSGRAQPGPSSWSSPGTATDSGTRPPGPASAAPPECLAPTPRLSPHTAVFSSLLIRSLSGSLLPVICLWLISRQYRPHSSQERLFKAEGLCRLHSFRSS